MAIENFLTYTEEDPNNRITITSSTITFASIARNETAYVYSDKGVNHFSGDFEHLLEINQTSGLNGGWNYSWFMSNDLGDGATLQTASKSYLGVNTLNTGDTTPNIYLAEVDSGTLYYAGPYVGALNTPYYIKVKRDEAVGTYGKVYCYIYSDSGRTTLLDTLELLMHTSKKDFRYIYGFNTYNDANTYTQSGYTKNLDLQEISPTNIKSFNGLAKASIKSVNGLAIASVKSINSLT